MTSNRVCVLCGDPWPEISNTCPTCHGFCTWGPEKGAEPDSWHVHRDRDGEITGFTAKSPPQEATRQ